MKTKSPYIAIVLLSFLASVALGMSDYETKSLVHLFTAEWGNIITLGLLTVFFSSIGFGVLGVVKRASGASS